MQSEPTTNWTSFAPGKALTPLGAASPLWAAYMGAAGAGVAFWWMTRWMQPANLEALFGREAQLKALEFEAAVEARLIETPVVEAIEAIEEVMEAVAAPAIAPEPVLETPAARPAPTGLSPTAKALIARRKAATSAKASRPA